MVIQPAADDRKSGRECRADGKADMTSQGAGTRWEKSTTGKSERERALGTEERYTVAPLSMAAERELGWAIVNENCRESREKMILANLHLVSNVACMYAGRGVSLGELVERGKVGLVRAVEHYDPLQGTRFSTPARWWIKQAMHQALRSPQSRSSACRRRVNQASIATDFADRSAHRCIRSSDVYAGRRRILADQLRSDESGQRRR